MNKKLIVLLAAGAESVVCAALAGGQTEEKNEKTGRFSSGRKKDMKKSR